MSLFHRVCGTAKCENYDKRENYAKCENYPKCETIRSAECENNVWSAVAQLVDCRTRNRESPGSNPVVTVSKFGHFLSLHDASVDSAV